MKGLKQLLSVTALIGALNASASVFTDTFDVSHDYDVDGVTGTLWDGFFYNLYGGNAAVAAADANVSNAGALTFQTTWGNWEKGDDDGILLYKTIEGDFDARVQILSMNVISYHDAGIIARVPDLADAGDGEDWVAVKHYANGGQCGHRSTDNSADATLQVGGLQPWLRLTRSGNTIRSYRSTDGVTWSQISSTFRNDMDGLALQVGIWQATFSGNEGTALFDNFSVRTPTTWNSVSNGSWTVSGNWTNGVPSGAGDWISFPGILQGDDVSVTLDGDQSAGALVFATTNSSAYSIDKGSVASVLALSGIAGMDPSITVNSGSHNISVPVAPSSNLIVTTAYNTEIKLRGGLSGEGNLIKEGLGCLTITGTNASYSGDTQVNGGTLSCLALPEGIQASYMFDNPDNLGEDSSVNGNDLVTGAGTPAYSSSGMYGGALYCDGSSYLAASIFPVGVPTGNTPYTIALWEKDDGSGYNAGFVGWGNNVANQCNNLRFNGNNTLINYWYANDWILSDVSPDPKDGNWHHVAITWDGYTQTFYLDGSYVRSTTRIGLNAQMTNFKVGRTTHGNDANFKGWLDNVQIANRALNASEINTLVQSGGLENLLPVDTSLQVSEGGIVDLNGSSQTLAGLSGGGRVTSSSVAPVALTVGSDGTSQEFSGGVDGEITFNKVGSGTLTFSGVNAYNGGTFVDEGTLVMSTPSLQEVLDSSKIWLDASDQGTFGTNVSGVVTNWMNKGSAGSTLDAVPITAGAGFTVLADELNGNSVFALDGTNGMVTSANTDISGSQNRTIFAVGCRKNNGNMYFAHTGSGANGLAFGIASETTLLFNYIWGGDIKFPVRQNDTYEIYDYMIENGMSSANLISGETFLSGIQSVSPNTVNTPLYLGSRFGGIGNGNIAELIFFDRALTQGERAGIEAYLRAKWFTGNTESILSGGAVSVAAGALLDLDGTSQTLTELNGSGSVTNGTLKVLNMIAPGGTNTVGTMNLADVAITDGTLLVDVTSEGSSDLLQVQGAMDLSGLSLQIADLDNLSPGTRYLILTCEPGSLTGSFESTNLTNGWLVSYNNGTGEVSLMGEGLLILLQ